MWKKGIDIMRLVIYNRGAWTKTTTASLSKCMYDLKNRPSLKQKAVFPFKGNSLQF